MSRLTNQKVTKLMGDSMEVVQTPILQNISRDIVYMLKVRKQGKGMCCRTDAGEGMIATFF
jgi:hypothetical protein